MVYNVIERILNTIPPEEHIKYALLRDKLSDLAHSTKYKAPEQMPEEFEKVARLLQAHLGIADTEWKRKIVKIFGDAE